MKTKSKRAFKLFRVRRDGTLGPLFINRRLRIEIGKMLHAECHPTKGFAVRPGWHTCSKPIAPHLSKRGRRWFVVKIEEWTEHLRPKRQGGMWYTAKRMTVIGEHA